jgi:hypothetical protein
LAVKDVETDTVSVMPSFSIEVVLAVISPSFDVVDEVPVIVGKMVA